MGFPGGSAGKECTYNAGDIRDSGLISGSGRSPGGRNGSPLQYSYLENPRDRGAWRATVHGVASSQTWLSTDTPSYYRVTGRNIKYIVPSESYISVPWIVSKLMKNRKKKFVFKKWDNHLSFSSVQNLSPRRRPHFPMKLTSQFHSFQKREDLLKVLNGNVIESNGLRLKNAAIWIGH